MRGGGPNLEYSGPLGIFKAGGRVSEGEHALCMSSADWFLYAVQARSAYARSIGARITGGPGPNASWIGLFKAGVAQKMRQRHADFGAERLGKMLFWRNVCCCGCAIQMRMCDAYCVVSDLWFCVWMFAWFC